MLNRYKNFVRLLIFIMLLSILKADDLIERNLDSYPLVVGKSFIFRITRLNWQYGFFTSSSNDYQYLKSDIRLVNDTPYNELKITDDNGGLNKLVAPINAIRINTAIQQMVRDSLYLEAGTRAIALFLFNRYPTYKNIDFVISSYNRKIQAAKNEFILNATTDTLYNKRLNY